MTKTLTLNAVDAFTIEKAAKLYAKVDSANPFAYNRIKHYMRKGYELPSDVIADAEARLKARGQQIEY